MPGYRVVSSDSHVFEPADLWTSRVEPRYRERAPHIVRVEDGSDWWVCDGNKLVSTSPAAQAGIRFEAPDKLTLTDTLDNVRPGGYVPEEHVKDMDVDGVDVGVLFPTCGLQLFRAGTG